MMPVHTSYDYDYDETVLINQELLRKWFMNLDGWVSVLNIL